MMKSGTGENKLFCCQNNIYGDENLAFIVEEMKTVTKIGSSSH